MGVDARVEWDGESVLKQATEKLHQNAERVGAFLSGEVVRSISTGQKLVKIKKRKKGGTRRKRTMRGLNPSKPNNPPHVLSGLLRASINHKVMGRKKSGVTVRIGAWRPYARALEFGNPKGNLAPRPYLRPAIYTNRRTIVEKFAKGLFK